MKNDQYLVVKRECVITSLSSAESSMQNIVSVGSHSLSLHVVYSNHIFATDMIESRQKMAGAGDTMLALPARSQ
jgi:hypothetical protein